MYNETAGVRDDFRAIDATIATGNLELAEWVMDKADTDCEGSEGLHDAAAKGYLESLQWFEDNDLYTKWDTGTLIKAAEAGQLKVVQWILDRDRQDDDLGYESGPNEYDSGYTEEDTGHTRDDRSRRTYITCLGGEATLAIHAAAINGHLKVAKYLYVNIDIPRNDAEKKQRSAD